MRMRLLVAGALWSALEVGATSFDNEAGVYVLTALPEPQQEAVRMDRMELSDQQPAGRYVRRGETLTIRVDDLPDGYRLSVAVGFLPMWEVQQTQQIKPINGETRFRADQDGPLFFKLNAPANAGEATNEVAVHVDGGRPLPLYVDGSMDAAAWADELSAHPDAPFVQLFGDQAMITLTAKVYARDPIDDPVKLVMFHQLKETYGGDLFKDLHKHFRARPLEAMRLQRTRPMPSSRRCAS